MIVSINGVTQDWIQQRYDGLKIIVAIDSSKRNSAIAIGDENGNLIDYIEFNGTADGTTEQDVLLLCKIQRSSLKTLLKGAVVKYVGIENIITKQENAGMKMHLARFKITAVFMSFISFFQDNFEITPMLVNNQTWKSAVLPEEFCKREYKKGSLAYFQSIHSKYQNCTDDVTDAICILQYLCLTNRVQSGHKIGVLEAARYSYVCSIVSSKKDKESSVEFLYNRNFTLKQNADVMANFLSEEECGLAKIPVCQCTLEEIYQFASGEFNQREESVYLLVRRLIGQE